MSDSETPPKPIALTGLQKRTANLLKGGKPGNKGGPGPTPKAFKDFIRDEIRNGFKSRHALVTASKDPQSKNFKVAWKLAADYDTDKPAEKHSIVGPVEVRVRIEREGRRVTSS